MKIHGVKRFNDNIFYTRFKKHCCPACGEGLKIIKISKVVDSASDEAKNFDFSNGDGFMYGNIKFIWTEFSCKKCNKNYSVSEIKAFEKGK